MSLNTTILDKTKEPQLRKQAITWSQVGRVIPPALGVIWLVIGFYPVLFILLTSLRSQAGFFSESPWLPPSQPTLSNYTNVWNNGFALYVVNSVFVSAISIVLIVIVSLLAAYAISRVQSRFVQVVFSLFLLGLAIPLQPAIITVTIYESIQVWNGFLFPLVLTQSPEVRVLPLALWSFQGQFTANVPAIMAAVFLSATPIILLYIVGRRQLLSGLIAGFSK